MAERRMFSKVLIDSDLFLDMPLSTQSLYFHLSMRADDDGFISNPNRIKKMLGCTDDDLNTLISNNFIIRFETGIVAIVHWKIHNSIRSDRYKETVYQKEKELITIDKNNTYIFKDAIDIKKIYIDSENNTNIIGIPSDNQVTTKRQPSDNQTTTNGCQMVYPGKDRLGKDRLGKDRLGKNRLEEDNKELEYTEKGSIIYNAKTDSQENPKHVKEQKHKYGEYKNILLTDQEVEKLKERFNDYDKKIDNISRYIASTGKKYKSHYVTILNWARREENKDKTDNNKLNNTYDMLKNWADK